jgi:hypothetical protein
MIRKLAGLATALGLMSAVPAQAGFILFETSGNFVVPVGVSSVNVLVMGGGGGGASGHQGGGGAGFLSTGSFAVTGGDSIAVTVGAGGSGALQVSNTNNIVGISAGGASSFGGFLSALGGGVVTSVNSVGQNGSSGGGGSCNGGSPGGNGGSNGGPCNQPFGFGQGDYLAQLALFTENVLSAGAGGAGGNSTHSGCCGGGILFNGLGPSAQDGEQSFSGQGGEGYGAGGGAGGYHSTFDIAIRWGGGEGADGLVYVEFLDAEFSVDEPGTLAILGLTVSALAFLRRRRKS